METSRTSYTTRRSLLAALLAAVLLTMAVSRAPRADADASIVIAALHVVEQQYVDPVRPAPLLNAAIATLRQRTHLGSDALPDIAPGTPEQHSTAQFSAEFSRAAQAAVIPETQLAYAAAEGMLASLHDSHTYFLRPQQLQEERRQLSGQPVFAGIGVTVAPGKDAAGSWIFVKDVFPGSPAAAAGIRRFDRIVEVNGASLRNVSPLRASHLLRGPAGSSASFVVQRGNQTLHLSVTRAPVRMQPVEAGWLQPGVAYVKVFEFSQGAGRDLRRALQELSSTSPIRSIILDLRGNPGGLITEAASVGGVFLPPHAVLARMYDRSGSPSVLRTAGAPLLRNAPMAVLVDGMSGSASEIVAGALKDHHRATMVGEKTAGALGGAITVALPEGGMSVTVDRILTPDAQRVEGVGINPNVPVALTVADMERGQDTQLQAALDALQQARSQPRTATSGARPIANDSRSLTLMARPTGGLP